MSAAPAVATTCPYCGVGCGLLVKPDGTGGVAIQCDPAHPANRGRLCGKGLALGETLGLEGRLLHPEIAGRRTDWDSALACVADGLRRVIAADGPGAVAFYVSGQLLTEDYYVANKLMKGFIGSANIDTNSRLCMAASVAGHRRAFGVDAVPACYEDLEQADLWVFVGSNAAWCHPVLWQRVMAARRARPDSRVVVIDPRRTASAVESDLHLALRPGSDVALFNGLLCHLRREDALDWGYIDAHTEGVAAALASAARTSGSIAAVAEACDLAPADVAVFYRWFTQRPRTLSLYSQGVNQSSAGTDKVNAIINCHLATGRVGRPGASPFSLTGQPNAMGGREVGGLANQLAAHMTLEDGAAHERVRRFWQAPALARKPGLKAVELFEAIGRGTVRAVWIMGTNPAVSLPASSRVRAALAACDLVVVSDCVRRTDTAALATVLLPALAWGEKSGSVTNSERRISRQRAFLPPPGEARADWWIVCEVARRLGFGAAFDFRGPADIFREHAALTAFENEGRRLLDLGALADADYGAMAPVQWPARRAGGDARRLFGDGRFAHADGRARFVALEARPPARAPDASYPLVLNTGRVRDHWHTLTRTGVSPRLSAHTPYPTLDLHPADAAALALRGDDLARVSAPGGDTVVRVRLADEGRPGAPFMPMHWGAATASGGHANRLTHTARDPLSGQPELKHAPVRIERITVAYEALLLVRERLAGVAARHWALWRGDGHWIYRLAGPQAPADVLGWARGILRAAAARARDRRSGEPASAGEWLSYHDVRAGQARVARLSAGRLDGCCFVAPDHRLLPRPEWLGALFAAPCLSNVQRRHLLAGHAADGGSGGPVVCACNGVGADAIRAAAAAGADTLAAIGRQTRAGTGCGACHAEITALIGTGGSRGR